MNVSCPQCTSVFRVDPAKVPGGGVRARCSVCSGVINVPEPSPEETVPAGATGSGASAPDWGGSTTPAAGWTPSAPTPEQPLPPIPLTPPRGGPTPVVGWGGQAGTATPADWGDWPHTASPFDSAHEVPPASRTPGEAGHGLGQMANPLTPQMPTPAEPYAATPPQPASAAPATPPWPAPATPPQAAPPHMPPAATSGQPARPVTPVPQGGGPPMPATPGSLQRAATTPATAGHVNPYLRRDPHERAQRLARALVSDIVTYYPEKHAEGVRDGTLTELFRDEIKKSYDDYVTQVGPELAQSTSYFQDALNEVLAGGKRLF